MPWSFRLRWCCPSSHKAARRLTVFGATLVVVAPLPTNRNTLWNQVGDWTVIVYPFIDGETRSHLGMTDENWKEVGTIVKQIHLVILLPLGFGSLRKETFNPTEYARWVRAFETQQTGSLAGNRVEYARRSYWMAHQPAIHTVLTSLEELAGVLQGRSGPYVIYHADLHPGNILRDPDGHLFVVDWDDVLAGFDLWIPLIYPR